MMFNDEVNFNSGAPHIGYVDGPSWKQQNYTNANAINDAVGNYDKRKWGMHNDYSNVNPGKGQHDAMANNFYVQNHFWNEQTQQQFHPQQLELHEPTKFMGGHGSYNVGSNIPMAGGTDNMQNWGRSGIDQTTPWDVNGTDQQQRFRKWDQQDNVNGYGPGFGPQQHNSGFCERMMPNGMPQMSRNMGMPIMGQRIGSNTQPWMDNVGKFGDHGNNSRGGAANPGSSMFITPPPPLGMMASHRQLIGPPPPLPSMHPGPALRHQSFTVTNFIPPNQMQQTTMGMDLMQLNEDSMWQDPNGDLRKWQRDTGTSIWGDPTKQTGPIQRWQQFTAEEVAATASTKSLKENEQENGWGELPPINGRGSSIFANTTSNGGEMASRSGANSSGNGSGGWTPVDANGGTGWNNDQPQPLTQSQQLVSASSMNNGTAYSISPNMPPSVPMPTVNTSNALAPSATNAQPLSSIPVTTATTQITEDQRQSPVLKVSLVEELSSFANGIGGIRNEVGSIWG